MGASLRGLQGTCDYLIRIIVVMGRVGTYVPEIRLINVILI